MALEIPDVRQRIMDRFPDATSDFTTVKGIFTLTVEREACKDLIAFLHSDETLRFNFLSDLCGVHFPQNSADKQFAVVYLLHNWVDNMRLRVKTFLPGDNPETDSMTPVFASANWMERETFDFYGIRFTGHPNLKRILNHDGMKVFPMRKEYPLEDEFRTDKDDRFFGREVNPHSLP